MHLKLIFLHDEKDNEFYRRIIQRIKLDPGCRSSKSGHNLLDAIRFAVRDGDAEPDAGAHGFLTLFERRQNGVTVGRLDLAEVDQQIHQLDDGRPTLGRLHLRDDLLWGKYYLS